MSNVMEVWSEDYFSEGLKWDDAYAPMECPGCLGDITGWTEYAAHQIAPGPGIPVGFIRQDEMHRVTRPLTVCDWDMSKLAARVHYRAYVDKWKEVALWGKSSRRKSIVTTDRPSTSGVTVFGSTEPAPLDGASDSSATPGS